MEKNGALTVVNIEVEEKSYAEFEAEIKKLEDYLNGLEGKKQSAITVAEGDKQAELAYRTMAYQVSKEICALAAPLQGKVDAILLTGGFAYDKMLMGWIEEYVGFLAPVRVYPGEDEMLALAQGAMRVLTGKETAKVY